MEPSEKEFLRKNKDELLELMRPSVQLNAYLEAKGFLKKGEQEEIDAKVCFPKTLPLWINQSDM